MKIVWVRGFQKIPINRPHTDFVLSPIRGGRKSSLLESRGQTYMRNGHTVFDFFGSRDSEGLAWGRNPMVDGVGKANGDTRMCLVHSDNVTVDSSFDSVPMSKLNHTHLNKYDILVSASALHKSLDDEYANVNVITDLLYDRREASNLYYSRLRVSNSQTGAKAYMIYLIREARHMGLALCMDTLKYTSIDIDIRVLVDNTFFKGQGYIGLPKDLHFIYRYFDPNWMRNMKANQFAILTKEGNLGVGVFPEVKWHKQEKENILKKLGIEIIAHEGMKLSQPQGKGLSVSDQEHLGIVETCCSNVLRKKHGLDTEKNSYREYAKKIGRSPATITNQMSSHDDMVAKHGYCPACRRSGGRLYQEILKKHQLVGQAIEARANSIVS